MQLVVCRIHILIHNNTSIYNTSHKNNRATPTSRVYLHLKVSLGIKTVNIIRNSPHLAVLRRRVHTLYFILRSSKYCNFYVFKLVTLQSNRLNCHKV